MKQILIIEDERDIYELLRFRLEKEGFAVTYAATGEAGVKVATETPPDLVLLDLMLPGMDGLEACRALRAHPRSKQVPIIMLTAKDEDMDVVTGLEVGADDYITKPFSPRVVVARVRAVMRRRSEGAAPETEVLQRGAIRIDPGRHRVEADGEAIALTATEFLLLHVLARRPGWVFSRSQLIDEMRGGEVVITDRAVDVQVVGLRKKLGAHGELIETVRGVGYRFRED